MADTKYVIVQHSAYGYNGDETFAKGLEVRSIDKKADITRVEKAGGLLFDSYREAMHFEETAPYPEGYEGLIPQAQGTFHSTVKVDGLAVYIPVRVVTG